MIIDQDILNTHSNLAISMRYKVSEFEQLMLQQPQLDLKTLHHFSFGIYARELFIPKGTILTGKIHKYPQLNILLEGTIDVLIEHEIKRLDAPFIVSSPAGTKRIAQAITDVRWLTVHQTDKTDLDEIEYQFIAQSEQEFLNFVTNQKRLPLFESLENGG